MDKKSLTNDHRKPVTRNVGKRRYMLTSAFNLVRIDSLPSAMLILSSLSRSHSLSPNAQTRGIVYANANIQPFIRNPATYAWILIPSFRFPFAVLGQKDWCQGKMIVQYITLNEINFSKSINFKQLLTKIE